MSFHRNRMNGFLCILHWDSGSSKDSLSRAIVVNKKNTFVKNQCFTWEKHQQHEGVCVLCSSSTGAFSRKNRECGCTHPPVHARMHRPVWHLCASVWLVQLLWLKLSTDIPCRIQEPAWTRQTLAEDEKNSSELERKQSHFPTNPCRDTMGVPVPSRFHLPSLHTALNWHISGYFEAKPQLVLLLNYCNCIWAGIVTEEQTCIVLKFCVAV